MEPLIIILVALLSYVLGSISSAILVCKLAGLPDPRSTGSKNPGATNVLRLGSKKHALLVLAGDMLKGVVPVVIAQKLRAAFLGGGVGDVGGVFGTFVSAFFGFKGGKGVATAFGVVFGFAWPLGIAVVAVWLAVAALFRFSSLAGLLAFLSAPLLARYVFEAQGEISIALLLIAVFLVWRHWENIKRLRVGTEPKLGR